MLARRWKIAVHTAAAALVVSVAATAYLSGCDQIRKAKIVVADPLGLPIQFSIGPNGDIDIDFSIGTPPTPWGRISMDVPIWSNHEDKKGAILKKDTILVVEHDVAGSAVRDRFRLSGQGQFAACMDGLFYQEYGEHEALIALLSKT